MPTNKRESLIFTFIMCFCMVFGMAVFNVIKVHGGFFPGVFAEAWLGLPPAYIVAMLCDWFIASPLAKGFAFKYLVKPGKSSPRATTLAVSTGMVVPMVIIMSLYGALEAVTHTGQVSMIPLIWLTNIPFNFVCALPWNLLVSGPLARTVFRRAFPMGTVLAQPVESAASAR